MHPGVAAILDLCENNWCPNLHRAIVQLAQNYRHCTAQGKTLRPTLVKKQTIQMRPVVDEPYEEVQVAFAGPLPDKLKKEAYILIAVDKRSNFLTANLVTNKTADEAKKNYAKAHISNIGVKRKLRIVTKVTDPKTFEQNYKQKHGKIVPYTTHTARVQTRSKQPRLLRNSGFAFVPSPQIYGSCRASRLSDNIAYKFAIN